MLRVAPRGQVDELPDRGEMGTRDKPEPQSVERGRNVVATLQSLIDAARAMIAHSRQFLAGLDAAPSQRDDRSKDKPRDD